MIDLSSCQKKTTYFEKDCKKFRIATKLIARGSPNSCSHAYAVAAGKEVCNTGYYTHQDIVGISAEGKRSGRISPDFEEIHKAIQANVQMFITDNVESRNSNYNIGEQQVACFLRQNGYDDLDGNGHWTVSCPQNQINNNSNKRKLELNSPEYESQLTKKPQCESVVVSEIIGDLLQPPPESIIVQQCNTICVRPKGLAESIGKRFPYANIYSFRKGVGSRNLAIKEDRPQLGTCLLSFPQFSSNNPNLPVVANLFAQLKPGPPSTTYKIFDIDNKTELVETSEQRKQWFRMALEHLKLQLETCRESLQGVSIWFPSYCGCGLACSKDLRESQWKIYRQMIVEFAHSCPFVRVSIVSKKW